MHSSIRLRSLLAVCVTLLTLQPCGFCLASNLDPDNPPSGLFSDEWLEVRMMGEKVGYGHATIKRDGDIIHTSTEMTMQIKRASLSLDIVTRQTTTEKVDGAPLGFSNEMEMGASKMAVVGQIKDGKIKITSSQMGFEKVDSYDYDMGSLLSWGAQRVAIKKGFKPGTKYTMSMYMPDMKLNGPLDATIEVGESETIVLGGRQVKGIRTTQTIDLPAGELQMVSWVDSDGRMLRAEFPMQGFGSIEMLAVDQESALSGFVAPEMFMNTTIASPKKIDLDKVRLIRYRLSADGVKDALSDIPATGMQTPDFQDDGSVVLTVFRQKHAHRGAASGAKGNDSNGLEEYRASNLVINTEDPELIRLAKEAAGGETDPFKLGDKLRRFVGDLISDKSMDVGFATASEVARNRRGDCSEHGVLLAALGRISGLPSRVVVGLAYVPSFGGKKDIFGYHMWTQFFIDGEWYDFDAALGESECSPARIALAVSSLKETGMVEISLPLLKKIGALKLEIMDKQ